MDVYVYPKYECINTYIVSVTCQRTCSGNGTYLVMKWKKRAEEWTEYLD